MPGRRTGAGDRFARLSVPGSPVCLPDWLALREDSDASARASELVEPLRAHLASRDAGVLVDLGCGTGSMGRWLARRLPGPQRWLLCDRDPELLARAGAGPPPTAADGTPVTVRTRLADLTDLDAADLAGTTLVTASALLDLLTAGEVDALAATCADAGCAALLTLTVTGDVRLDPADPLDAELAAAFNAHQRRRTGDRRLLGPDAAGGGRRLLGPDAAAAAVDAFASRGARVRTAPSPWRLGRGQAELTEEWLRGWLDAALEQRPGLGPRLPDYLRRRLAACAVGELSVTVGHLDVLALPSGEGP